MSHASHDNKRKIGLIGFRRGKLFFFTVLTMLTLPLTILLTILLTIPLTIKLCYLYYFSQTHYKAPVRFKILHTI